MFGGGGGDKWLVGVDKNGVNFLTDQPCNGNTAHDTCPEDSFTGETGLRCYNQCQS